jgi:RNA polymerase sigma factor (sigma-70 family)
MDLFKDYANYDDEKLIRLIAQTRVEALAQLYDRYHRLVFSLALSIIGDRGIAEEVTLDVFMRVWQKAETYRSDIAKVSTWIIHIARHHAIDVLRHQSIRPDQRALSWDEVNISSSNPMHGPEELAELSMLRERVRAASSTYSISEDDS